MDFSDGASCRLPSLDMATPLLVPFSNSSNLDCCQSCVPSAHNEEVSRRTMEIREKLRTIVKV